MALATGLGAGLAQAQSAAGSGLTVQPRIGLTQTWTDNNGLRADAKDAALISVLSPGLTVGSNSGRIKGSLDYSLNGVLYLKSEQKNRVDQSLAAVGVAELVENTLYVDMRASIAQQAASAFGQQTPNNSFNNLNRTEVASLSLSPYLRGTLARVATYELRGTALETNAKDSIIGDTRSSSGSLRIDGIAAGALGWWTTASTQKSHFKSGTNSGNASLTAGLRYRLDTDLNVGLNAGRERSDYLGGGQRSGSNYGLNAKWTPTPRTALVSDWQSHDYGNAHLLSFEHRMAHSSWRYSDSQSVSLGSGTGATGTGSNYDLFFFQFASQEPDPIKRDVLVRSYLQGRGLSPDAISTSGFLTAGPTLMRSQQASFSLEGLRTTITATASQSSTRSLSAAASGSGDLAQSGRVLQRGFALNLAHRLTPIASANLTLTQQQSRGDQTSQSTTLRAINANWTGRLGARAAVSLGLRHSRFDSATPYRENAVFANLVQQF